MVESIKSVVRGVQVHFPILQDARFALSRGIGRITRIPAEEDFKALKEFGLDAGSTVLDVGANRGFAIEAFRMLTPAGKIVAFEPNPVLCDRLRAIYRGDARVEMRNVGLGDERGEFTLHIPYYKRWCFDGLASFDRAQATGWLPGRLAGYDERHLSVREAACRIERLDDLELAPDFIKLDVQGFELKALQGAVRTLERAQPSLLIESAGKEIREFLATLGYVPHAWERGRLHAGRKGTLNTFFLTEKRAAKLAHLIVAPPA